MTEATPPAIFPLIVLVVGGEDGSFEIVKTHLSPRGHELVHVRHEGDIDEVLAGSPPDVILFSGVIPGQDQYNLIRQFRQRSGFKVIPSIYLSEESDRENLGKMFDAGVSDFIKLPVVGPELANRVQALGESGRASRNLDAVIREKNHLLEVVAHDLKNPLSAIRFAISMISDMPDMPVEARAELMQGIEDSTQKAFEIVSELLVHQEPI